MRTRLISVSLVFFATGCVNDLAQDPVTGLVAEASEAEPVIVGGIDWTEVTTLDAASEERVNSRAVGYLSIPAVGTRCTAFLIADDVVMTNEHCIERASSAEGATVYFRREQGVPYSEWAGYDCSTFLGNDAGLDFALLRCSGSPGATHGVVEFEARDASTGHGLYVIHQNCDYYSSPSCEPTKKHSPGRVTRVDSEVRHDADTLGGSSGSPVFSATSHKVFALHHVGLGNNGNGRGTANYAVPMTRILPEIARRWPDLVLGGGGPAQPSPTTPAGDALEPNDDIGSASALDAPFDVSALGITPGDVDVFRIIVASRSTLRAQLRFSHASGDLDATLSGAADPSAALARGTSSDDDEDIALEVEAGTYYLSVYGYNGAANAYELTVTMDAAAADPGQQDPPAGTSGSGDAFEPNDAMSSAALIELPFAWAQLAIGPGGDEDWFAFDTDATTRRVQIDFSHAAGDLDLYLYDAAGNVVHESAGVRDQERVDASLPAGRYYARVVGYSGATGSYTLTLE